MICKASCVWILLCLVWVAACDEQGPAGDHAANRCEPAPLDAPVKLDLELRSDTSAWTESDGELVAVSTDSADSSSSYVIQRLGMDGQARGDAWTVSAGSVVTSELSIAAVGGMLAIANLGDDPQGQCLLSVLRLADGSVVRMHQRVSDAKSDDTVMHQARSCRLAATADGFVVAWQQSTNAEDDTGLFAQRFALDGSSRGERVTLLESAPLKKADLALASRGAGALIAYRGADQQAATLAFVEPDSLRSQPLAGVEVPVSALQPAHEGGFMLRTGSNKLYLLDSEGRVTSGPRMLNPASLVAAFGDGYLRIDQEEYLVARALDSTLDDSSAPLGLSEDREAWPIAVLAMRDGSAALIYGDMASRKLVQLGCGSKPGPLGPQACSKVAELEPLDPGCKSGEICHVVLRFDYLTLGARGWSVSSEAPRAVDAAQAEQAAQEVFAANSEYLVNPLRVTGPAAGLYEVFQDPSDFGGFALVSQNSGAVVVAGGVVWSGRGSYWRPDTWQPASAVRCGNTQAKPSEQVLDDGTCTGDEPQGTTAAQAMSLALSTNLARAIADTGPFSARAYLYTPTVGACFPGVAEWLVVLSPM